MIPDLKSLKGKKVILETPEETYEGRIVAASGVGVVLQLRGGATEVVEASLIEGVEILTEANLRRKRLKVPAEGKYRQHLVDHHGYPFGHVNSLSEAEAEAIHRGLDHEDLGHFHKAGPVE